MKATSFKHLTSLQRHVFIAVVGLVADVTCVYGGQAILPSRSLTADQSAVLKGDFTAITSQLATDIGIKLIPIPAGTFMMGSPLGETGRRPNEGPQTRVVLTKSFLLGATPVTNGQYDALMAIDSTVQSLVESDAPINSISWTKAMEFCEKLNERENASGRLPDGYVFTLPTEAQWEFACRAGTNGPYPGNIDAMAWYDKNSHGMVHKVAQKQPNAWGLYDMIGNMREWCFDWYSSYPGGTVIDPTGPAFGSGNLGRVARNGGWNSTADECRSSARSSVSRATFDVGFRIALNASADHAPHRQFLVAPLTKIDLSKLYGPFRSESFLEAAIALQGLPEDQRLAELRTWAQVSADLRGRGDLDEQLIVLFRMLFAPGAGQTFWRVGSINPEFVGDSVGDSSRNSADGSQPWPLDPIILVDGIPFFIENRSMIAEVTDSSKIELEHYVARMLPWTSFRYSTATLEERRKALVKLVNEHSWPRQLTGKEIMFLTDQVGLASPAPLDIESIVTRSEGLERGESKAKSGGRLTIMDRLLVNVSGAARPFNIVVVQQGSDGTEPRVITSHDGRPLSGDPFYPEELEIPWPNPTPSSGDRLIVKVTNREGSQVVQTLKVIGPREVEISKPIEGKRAAADLPANR